MTVVYNDIHNVTVHTKPNGEKHCTFRILVEQDNNVHGKALNVKLTDDNDPTFLYCLLLNEEDFSILKSQQGLRVEFDNFPKQLSKLLADCKNREGQFRLVLDDHDTDDISLKSRAGCYLKVIESNEFKNLCHLSLQVAAGSDADVQRHLCQKLTSLQEQLEKIKTENCRLFNANSSISSELLAKDKRIADLELRIVEETSAVRLELSHQLASEKEKKEQERIEVEAQRQRVINGLQNDVALLTHRNNILSEAKQDLETNLKVLTLKNETAEKDLERLTSTNDYLKSKVSSQEQKIASLEQHLTSAQRRLSAAEEARAQLSSAMGQARRDLQAGRERENVLMGRLKPALVELSQAQEKVGRLEEEVNAKRAKMANLTKIIDTLEKQLHFTRAELESKSEIVARLQDQTSKETEELQETKARVELLEKQVKEQENKIKRQIDVNTCLHRKLTEKDMTLGIGQSLNGSSVPPDTRPQSRLNSTEANNRSLPPWVTASANCTGRISPAELESRKGANVLDPSYLIPADEQEENRNKLCEKKLGQLQLTSAYFPLKPASSS